MATVQNCLRYFPDASYTDLATNTTLGTSTRLDTTSKTLTISETSGRAFKSVMLRAHFRDRFTVANEIIAVRMGIKLGAAAAADTDRAFTMANTGDHARELWELDVTDYFTTNFGGATTQTCICSLAVATTAASNMGGTIWFELWITYEHDDSATTLTKSIPIMIQSHHTFPGTTQVEIGTTGGTTNAPANQIPALDTYLEEASKTYKDVAIIWRGQSSGTGTSDTTAFVQIDALGEVTQGLVGQALLTFTPISGLYNYPFGSISTASAHAFKMRTDIANMDICPGAEMWVTYTYDRSTTTRQMNYGILALSMPGDDQRAGYRAIFGTDNISADAVSLVANIDIQEPGTITLKQSGVLLYQTNISGGNFIIKAGSQAYRTYTTVSGAEHFIAHRCDHSSGWTLARGSNDLRVDFYSSLSNRQVAEGFAYVVYSSDVPPTGCTTGNRPLVFLNAVYGTTPSALFNFAASGGGQRPVSVTAPWSLSNYGLETIGRAGQENLGHSATIFAEVRAGEYQGAGWTIGQGSAINMVLELTCRENVFGWTSKYNKRSLGSTGKLDINTGRRFFFELSNATPIIGFHTFVTVHNVTYTVAGTLTIDGSTAADGKTIKIWAYDAFNNAELVTTCVTAGGAGAFTVQVPGNTRTYFATHQNGSDNGTSAELTPGGSFAIVIRGSGGGDVTDPTITVISQPTKSTDPLVVSIYDASGFSYFHVTCKDRTDGRRLTVYDPVDGSGNAGFVHPFNGKSTLTGSGSAIDPYIFTIYRRGRWPTGISLDVRAQAIDTKGNEINS